MKRIIVALFIMLIPLRSYAMTIDDLPITGVEHITDIDAFNAVLAPVPSAVAVLYAQRGGRITTVPIANIDSIARRYDNYTQNVNGLYVYKSKRIYIAKGESLDMAFVLRHELGHFLWRDTRPSWSAAARNRFTDDEEFATFYAARWLDIPLIESIEQSIEKLIER